MGIKGSMVGSSFHMKEPMPTCDSDSCDFGRLVLAFFFPRWVYCSTSSLVRLHLKLEHCRSVRIQIKRIRDTMDAALSSWQAVFNQD